MASPPPPSAPNTRRNPPPQLFQAPTNASSISLTSPSSTGTTRRAPPLPRSRSARNSVDIPTLNRPGFQSTRTKAAGQAEENRVDALWAKMQLTLEEVELSALGSTHVFGKAHNAALEELRSAQIALAKAWGRGEADEEFAAMDAAWATDDFSANAGDGVGSGREAAGDGGELAEAKKRREANERFFQKVGEGVVDVVGKLDGVAAAMAKVEKESREIWDERDSVEGASVAS